MLIPDGHKTHNNGLPDTACVPKVVQLRDVTTGSLSAVRACAEPPERELRSWAAAGTGEKLPVLFSAADRGGQRQYVAVLRCSAALFGKRDVVDKDVGDR